MFLDKSVWTPLMQGLGQTDGRIWGIPESAKKYFFRIQRVLITNVGPLIKSICLLATCFSPRIPFRLQGVHSGLATKTKLSRFQLFNMIRLNTKIAQSLILSAPFRLQGVRSRSPLNLASSLVQHTQLRLRVYCLLGKEGIRSSEDRTQTAQQCCI